MIFFEELTIIRQVVVEAGGCREPQHPPLNHARDFDVILQSLQNFCFLECYGHFCDTHTRGRQGHQIHVLAVNLVLKDGSGKVKDGCGEVKDGCGEVKDRWRGDRWMWIGERWMC